MDAKLKHLELIQGVINRFAGNSFYMKGWTVVLLSALLVLVVREDQGDLSLLGSSRCWSSGGSTPTSSGRSASSGRCTTGFVSSTRLRSTSRWMSESFAPIRD